MCCVQFDQYERTTGPVFFTLCFFSIIGDGLMIFEWRWKKVIEEGGAF